MSISKCFSNSNKKLQELYVVRTTEDLAAIDAINNYHQELSDKLNNLRQDLGKEVLEYAPVLHLPENQNTTIEKDIRRSLSERVEKAYKKFYEKISSLDKSRYDSTYASPTRETIVTTEAKIERLQEALDATVVIDTTLPGSGVLLASNHPITILNGKPTIAINPDKLYSDTVFHEFGHLYIDLLGEDEIVEKAIESLRGSELWKQVGDNWTGPKDKLFEKEVLATALGIEGDNAWKNEENQGIWNKIRNVIYNLLNKLFNLNPSNTDLKQLAAEMMTNRVRVSSTESFNTLVDQWQKDKIENPTQAKILQKFKELREKYNLDEETHVYKNTETNESYTHSVSSLSKMLSRGYVNIRKGSYNVDFDKAYELTKDNYMSIITQARIPKALDDALNEVFKGEIDAANVLIPIEGDQYWYHHYTSIQNNDAEMVFFDNTILDNLDVINTLAQQKQDFKDIPLVAGNRIHDALEAYIEDPSIGLPSNIDDRSGRLLKTIKGIIDKGTEEGSKFVTEQMLFSSVANMPGTADLIEITKDGKFRIYDYKTMTSFKNSKGRPKTDFEMYIINGYLNQLLIYSTILEEYGIEPADGFLNIIAVEVDRRKLLIDDETSPLVVYAVRNKNIDPKHKTFNKHVIRSRNTILSKFRNPSKMKEFSLAEPEAKINDLVQKIQRGLKDYRKLTDPRNPKFAADLPERKTLEKIDDYITKLDGENNKAAVLSYISNIRDALYSVYNNTANKGQGITSEYLANLEFLLQAASFTKDVKDFIINQSEDFIIEETDKIELLALLDETEGQLRRVQGQAELNTKQLAVETLATYSNFGEGLWTEKFEIEAREQGITNLKDIQEYVMQKLQENEPEIRKKEFDYWADLMTEGYTDIRYLEWLLADPGMNKSQFVQVVKNVIDKVDQDVRYDLDNAITDLVNWHKNLKIKKTGDPKKIWGKFTEQVAYTDTEDKLHKYTDSTVIPEFTSEYRDTFFSYQAQLEYYEREISKAQRKNDKKRVALLIENVEATKDNRSEALKDADKELVLNPVFEKLTTEEQEVLRFIHKSLEKSDDRLIDAPFKKLVRELKDGSKIYNLPKMRTSAIEAAYRKDNKISRFGSALLDYVRPAKDEDELNIVSSEFGEDEQQTSFDDKDEFRNFKTNSTDILGNPLYDIPIYYRNNLEDPTLQSFDIPSLLALNHETTIMYENHKMIEADLFMITNALKNVGDKGNVLKTDAVISNNVIDKIKGKLPKTLTSNDNKVLKAVQASINNRFYKRTYAGVYSKTHYMAIKGFETLGSGTSALLLAGNFASGSMTGIQGSIYRLIEGFAQEDFTSKDVRVGMKKAWLDINNVLIDSQKQFPESKSLLLIRRFGLEQQYSALVNKFVQDNFVKKNLVDETSLYAVTHLAETIVTSNLMYTLMNNIKAMNKDKQYVNSEGKVVDRDQAMTLDEAYTIEEGKLKLNKHVAYTDRNLSSEFVNSIDGEKTIAATEISRYIRSKYADLYGQYNQNMKSVAEMSVWGKLAFSMRKWMPRGFHRRWRGITHAGLTFDELKKDENLEKRFYSQDQKKFQEGYYTTAIRYIGSLMKEMKDKQLSFAMAQNNINTKLTTHERANLKRTAAELGVLILSWVGAMTMRAIALEMDDEDKDKDRVYFIAYLSERIKIETATFLNPGELVTNIKNPAAAVNTITRIQRLMSNLFGVSYNKDLHTFDWEIDSRYENGARKGDLKVWRNMQGLIPYYKKTEQGLGIIGVDSKESIKDSYEYMIR